MLASIGRRLMLTDRILEQPPQSSPANRKNPLHSRHLVFLHTGLENRTTMKRSQLLCQPGQHQHGSCRKLQLINKRRNLQTYCTGPVIKYSTQNIKVSIPQSVYESAYGSLLSGRIDDEGRATAPGTAVCIESDVKLQLHGNNRRAPGEAEALPVLSPSV